LNTIQLIEDGPASGAWNMAVDEVLLASAAEIGTATLRFYRWEQPILSLGYFQPKADRQSHPASWRCPLVRRHSGGGAIVHDDELTYALAWPLRRGNQQAGRADETANQLYAIIHSQLVQTLAKFGLEARLHEPPPGNQPSPATAQGPTSEPFLCFQRRAPGDVVLGEYKVLGSAQRRKRGAILQHGSLLLARSWAAPELPGLAELAPTVNLGELTDTWKTGIFAALGVEPELKTLTDWETTRAEQLAADKFLSTTWTNRR
jgi:lipoate-protein ligase A